MSKINLKSLENTVVHTPTEAEYDELMKIYEDAGWKWVSLRLNNKLTKEYGL